MEVINNIKAALVANYNPAVLDVLDESEKHHGHAGYGQHSHLCIKISLEPFKHLSRIDRERTLRSTVLTAAGQDIHAIRFEFV